MKNIHLLFTSYYYLPLIKCVLHVFDCYLTCDAEILDWSWRAVRSEDETLAGAPRWSRMLTFLSLSAREIARGDVLPKSKRKKKITNQM